RGAGVRRIACGQRIHRSRQDEVGRLQVRPMARFLLLAAQHRSRRTTVTATTDIVPDSERRGFIGALPPRLRPYAWLMRLQPPSGTLPLFLPPSWRAAA